MAYRVEIEGPEKIRALIIDGFEDGVANSPYLGIMILKNVNIAYLEGGTYVNYKRQRIITAGGNTTFTGQTSPSRLNYVGLTLNVGDAVRLTTTGTLPTGLSTGTTYFVQARTSTTFQLASSLGGSAIVITGTGSGTNTVTLVTMKKPKYVTIASSSSAINARTYILDRDGQVWQDSGTQTTTNFPYFVLLAGNNPTGGDGTGLVFWMNYLFVFRDGGIEVCGNGTSYIGITSSNWVNTDSSGYFAPDLVTVDITPVTQGDTVVTLTDPWPYATGVYKVTFTGQQMVDGSFVNDASTFTITPAANGTYGNTEVQVELLAPSATSAGANMAFVSYLSNSIYFCNVSNVGAINQVEGQNFDPTDFITFNVDYKALDLPSFERAIWIDQIGDSLMIAGRNFIYPWDTRADTYSSPIPVNEEISRIFNILNQMYVFAGQKGNIYLSNGYNISLVKKIPDSFTNSIDPSWTLGGFMFHRYKLWFGGYSTNADDARMNGIFSLDIKNENALAFESQGSTGITPTGTSSPVNVLVDLNNQLTSDSNENYRVDRYYSAYEDNAIGCVDYNDTTPWGNFEPMIETDLIPVGTILQKRTFENIEYKLDKPLATNDQIRISFRETLADSYTVIGTTNGSTNQVISETFSSNVNEAQWLQFKIEMACASSNSSYNRLREIRIH